MPREKRRFTLAALRRSTRKRKKTFFARNGVASWLDWFRSGLRGEGRLNFMWFHCSCCSYICEGTQYCWKVEGKKKGKGGGLAVFSRLMGLLLRALVFGWMFYRCGDFKGIKFSSMGALIFGIFLDVLRDVLKELKSFFLFFIRKKQGFSFVQIKLLFFYSFKNHNFQHFIKWLLFKKKKKYNNFHF